MQVSGWRWGYRPDGAIAVMSPDESYAVMPFYDVNQLLSSTKLINSMSLLFNMVVGGALPQKEVDTQVLHGWHQGPPTGLEAGGDDDFLMPPPPPPPLTR